MDSSIANFAFRNLDFAAGEPSGGPAQNMVKIGTKSRKLFDIESETRFCASCSSLKNATFTLRGTCLESFFSKY